MPVVLAGDANGTVVTGTTSGKLAFTTWYYDEGTRRLNREVVSNQGVSGSIVDSTYGYDQAGNVTRIADVAGTVDDVQCFTYDFLGQVKEAWAMATGACGTPSQTVMGGSAQYWTSYTYDEMGNRKTKVEHPKTGSNTIHTYAYPTPGPTAAPNPTTGAVGPHAVSSVARQVGTNTATTTSYKYDAAGNMTARGSQQLTWDAEGEMSSSKAGTANAATNVYDADGNRILRRDDTGVSTLYLDSTEIKLTGTTKTAQRWYQFGGKAVATRTSAGISLLAADHHDTAQVQMSATAPTSYTKRRFDPFGAQRTGVNTSGWSGDHGFLDKSVDKTGLTMVGARYYDSGLGKFISVDPMLVVDDPQQINAYSYAGNNPVTDADPTGEMLPTTEGGGHSRPSTSPSPSATRVSTPAVDPPVIDWGSIYKNYVKPKVNVVVKEFKNSYTSMLTDFTFGAYIGAIKEHFVAPRAAAAQNLKLGGSASARKRMLRDLGREQARQLGYGDGKGADKGRLLADTQKLSKTAKVLGIFGIGVAGVMSGKEEWDENEEKSTGERVARTAISTSTRVAGATLVGGAFATACSPGVVLAALCGAGGAWVGETAGGALGDTINYVAFDSGIEWNPMKWG